MRLPTETTLCGSQLLQRPLCVLDGRGNHHFKQRARIRSDDGEHLPTANRDFHLAEPSRKHHFQPGQRRHLTINGILKSGNNSGSITGGTAIEASSGAEMVIRTDKANDALAINLPVLDDGSNPLTKSGAGTLTFGAVNTYKGITTLNSGTVSFTGSSGSTGGGSLIVGGAAGNAVLNLASTGTVTFNGADVGGITGTLSSPSGAGAIDQSFGTFNYSNGPPDTSNSVLACSPVAAKRI